MNVLENWKKNLFPVWDFTRKCNRSDYWVINIMVILVQISVFALIMAGSISLLSGILIILVFFIGQLATIVARIRDAGYNVLWILVFFIPYWAVIPFIVFGCLESAKDKK